jgi:hypothetical protein
MTNNSTVKTGEALFYLFDCIEEEMKVACAQRAMNWFTLPPRLRTKEKLRKMILNTRSKVDILA